MDSVFTTERFRYVLIVQFWWISLWGLVYVSIEWLVGKNKVMEFWIYAIILFFTMLSIQINPNLLDKLY
jgi:hypothetical protein